MNTLTFDKLSFVDKLKAGGFTEEQARTQADALDAAFSESVATKRDLKELEVALRSEIRESEMRLIKWLIPLLLGQAALVAALVKLL